MTGLEFDPVISTDWPVTNPCEAAVTTAAVALLMAVMVFGETSAGVGSPNACASVYRISSYSTLPECVHAAPLASCAERNEGVRAPSCSSNCVFLNIGVMVGVGAVPCRMDVAVATEPHVDS